MSGGIIGQGTKSGIIGASYSDTVLLYAKYESLTTDPGTLLIGANARGTGKGAHGSGDLFQKDFFYYKVYFCGFGYDEASYTAVEAVNASGAKGSGFYGYYQAGKGEDDADNETDFGTAGDNMIKLQGNGDNQAFGANKCFAAAGIQSNGADQSRGGSSACEMLWFNPAGGGYTNWHWTYTQAYDSSGDMRQVTGGGMTTTAESWVGFKFIPGSGTPAYNAYVNVAVYGLRSMGANTL